MSFKESSFSTLGIYFFVHDFDIGVVILHHNRTNFSEMLLPWLLLEVIFVAAAVNEPPMIQFSRLDEVMEMIPKYASRIECKFSFFLESLWKKLEIYLERIEMLAYFAVIDALVNDLTREYPELNDGSDDDTIAPNPLLKRDIFKFLSATDKEKADVSVERLYFFYCLEKNTFPVVRRTAIHVPAPLCRV